MIITNLNLFWAVADWAYGSAHLTQLGNWGDGTLHAEGHLPTAADEARIRALLLRELTQSAILLHRLESADNERVGQVAVRAPPGRSAA